VRRIMELYRQSLRLKRKESGNRNRPLNNTDGAGGKKGAGIG